eukprot:4297841-Alexandrium_andersonii.AAC.1
MPRGLNQINAKPALRHQPCTGMHQVRPPSTAECCSKKWACLTQLRQHWASSPDRARTPEYARALST